MTCHCQSRSGYCHKCIVLCSEQHQNRQECGTDSTTYLEIDHSEDFNSESLIHTQKNADKCDICNTVPSQSDTPKAPCCHKVEKPYKCDLCDKCASEVNLKRQCRVHTKGKSHKCDICNEEFSVSAVLRIHSLSHLVMKTHKCDIRLREFTINEILEKHYVTHTCEKPYMCNICGKDFS